MLNKGEYTYMSWRLP